VFELFPGDYSRSQAVNMGLRSGLQIGEAMRAASDLAKDGSSAWDWYASWRRFAEQQVDQAEDEFAEGFVIASGERMLRASVGLYVAQARIPDRRHRLDALREHWRVFDLGIERSRLGYERVSFDSPDGELPAWWIPGSTDGSPTPALVYYPGFDLDKEMIVLTLRDSYQRRGIGVLIVDGPGIGETLWLQQMPSRYDYEVPSRAARDYLKTRSDVVADNIGVAGISLGGYYATRSAAFEPSFVCCSAWAGTRNFGGNMRRRWDPQSQTSPEVNHQLMAVMGKDNMRDALERVIDWNLTGQVGGLHMPYLMVHGELDRQSTLAEAKAIFREIPAEDKTLRVFTAGEGGAEHCQIDEPIASREYISDWTALRMGTVKPA